MSAAISIVQKNAWRWFLIVSWTFMAFVQFWNYLADKQPNTLLLGIGALLFTTGFYFSWPIQRKGEKFASLPPVRKLTLATSFIGAFIFLAAAIIQIWSR